MVVVVWSTTWVGGRCVVNDADGWLLSLRWWLTTWTVVVAIAVAMVAVGSCWIVVVVAVCQHCSSGGGVQCVVDAWCNEVANTIRKCL